MISNLHTSLAFIKLHMIMKTKWLFLVLLADSSDKIKPKSFSEQDFLKRKRELEFMLKRYALKINDQKEYLREMLSQSNDKSKILIVIFRLLYSKSDDI